MHFNKKIAAYSRMGFPILRLCHTYSKLSFLRGAISIATSNRKLTYVVCGDTALCASTTDT